MTDLQAIITSAPVSDTMRFRSRPYGQDSERFLIDILALANAKGVPIRMLCLGVEANEDGRQIIGLPDESLNATEDLVHLVASFIEPKLNIRYQTVSIEQKSVAVLVLSQVTETPYLMAKDYSQSLAQGSGFVQNQGRVRRLGRNDLLQLFKTSRTAKPVQKGVLIAFATKDLKRELSLPALPLHQLPSRVAGDRIRSFMTAKAEADKAANLEDSRIERLMHARLYGHTAPYQQLSPEALLEKLANASVEHADADRYYTAELRSHKINFVLFNSTETEYKDVNLRFEIPTMHGLEISDQIYAAPNSGQEVPTGYPALTLGKESISASVSWKRIPAGSRITTFSQPLRVQLREAAIGRTLSVRYFLQAKNLDDMLMGTLTIKVTQPVTK